MICPILSRSTKDPEGNTTWEHHDCIEKGCTFWAQEGADCGILASRVLVPVISTIEKTASSVRETGLKLLEGVSALEGPVQAVGAELGSRLETLQAAIARLETLHDAIARLESMQAGSAQLDAVQAGIARLESMQAGSAQLDAVQAGIARLEEGIETIRAGLAGHDQRRRRDDAMAFNSRGVALCHRGAVEAAEAAFRSALDLEPVFAEAHNNLGLALSRQGRGAEAEASFQKALELDPAMAEAMNNLGFLFHQGMQFEKAVEMFRRSALEGGEASVAYTNLGNACYKLGRYSDAVAAWKKAVERDPLNEPALNALKMFQQAGG